MQTIYVNVISMNYENVYGYLCFCCADAVDCEGGRDELRGWLGWGGLPPPCRPSGLRIKSTMTCCRVRPAALRILP